MVPGAHFDQDGRLHLARVAISKAGVSRYRGRDLLFAGGGDEIEADETYAVFRPPAALQSAASTFKCVPILERHIRLAEDTATIKPDDIVGTLGSHVAFDGVYLTADAVVWAQSAIDGIADGSKAAPSAGYEFSIEHSPGVYRGERYSHVMRRLARSSCHALRPLTRGRRSENPRVSRHRSPRHVAVCCLRRSPPCPSP